MLGHRTLNVEDYLSILKRRWWIIAVFTILFPVAAVGVTYFVTPEYVSETLILIDQQKVPTDFVQPVATQALDSRLAIITEQVLSRSNIQPIIEKYNLFANQHLSMDARVDLMRDPKTLKIEPVHNEIARSNGLPGFNISFTANDPQTAQQVCAEITSLFTKTNLRAREENARGTTDFLQEQLDGATRNLTDMDAKIAAFQHQNAGSLPEDQANNMSIMASLNTQLETTNQQIQAMESNRSVGETLLAQQEAEQAAAATAPGTTAAPVRTSQAQQKELDDLQNQKADLETRYTADYPEVKDVNRKIADLEREMNKAASAPAPVTPATAAPKHADSAIISELRARLAGYDQQISVKRKQQEQIQQEIRTYEGRISASPQVESKYKELTRDYETAQKFHDQLLGEMNQSQMTTSLENRQEGETFSILDAASLPTDPIYPKRSYFAGGGLGAGIAFGVLIVALLEYKDTALRTERDIWDFTQLPTLAIIAWSGDVANLQPTKTSRLKRLFSRKPSKDLLADSTG
ncbi:MAG: Wzz/FepE/Etk N-terminal domain-containing protein [Acidobacteriaceae bacterium]|jgi:polysaccharide chain length determinant protein (PEP-CTERM system associated)